MCGDVFNTGVGNKASGLFGLKTDIDRYLEKKINLPTADQIIHKDRYPSTGVVGAPAGHPQTPPLDQTPSNKGKGDEGKGDEGKGDEGKGDEGKGDEGDPYRSNDPNYMNDPNAVAVASARRKRRALMRRGLASTIKTGPGGLAGDADITKPDVIGTGLKLKLGA